MKQSSSREPSIVKKRLHPLTGFDNLVRRRTLLRAVRIPVSDCVVLVFSLAKKPPESSVRDPPRAHVTSIAANLDSRSVR